MKIPCAGVVYDKEEIRNIKKAAETFWIAEGEWSKRFADGLCEFMGMKYCVLCNSGSSANLLAVTALGLPAGSEVITTACGFPTTLNPILQNNLIPVFVDIDPETYGMEVRHLAWAINQGAKAIMVSHTLGNPVPMDIVMRIARKHKLFVIEDNCDALGSRYQGQLTGTFGDMCTLSFYPAHHITTVEGGAVLTNNEELYKRLISYRNWGRDCICRPGQDNACGKRFDINIDGLRYDHKYIFSHIGYNLKMTDLQAAVGVAQLKKLPDFIKRRQENFTMLYEGLQKYEDKITLPASIGEPCWFGFPILGGDAQLIGFLEKSGIATRRIFGGNLLKQPAYKNIKYRAGSLYYSDLVMRCAFWIGLYPALGKNEMYYIINKFGEYFGGKR